MNFCSPPLNCCGSYVVADSKLTENSVRNYFSDFRREIPTGDHSVYFQYCRTLVSTYRAVFQMERVYTAAVFALFSHLFLGATQDVGSDP